MTIFNAIAIEERNDVVSIGTITKKSWCIWIFFLNYKNLLACLQEVTSLLSVVRTSLQKIKCLSQTDKLNYLQFQSQSSEFEFYEGALDTK